MDELNNDTWIKLQKELSEHKDTLVLNFFEVVRVKDVQYADDDFFWVFDTELGPVYSSCCTGFVPLKGVLSDREYNRLVKIWNLNNVNKAI